VTLFTEKSPDWSVEQTFNWPLRMFLFPLLYLVSGALERSTSGEEKKKYHEHQLIIGTEKKDAYQGKKSGKVKQDDMITN
jgi:hypothetical protein